MSLELKDIRCKVHPTTHAFLSGEAISKGVDVCVVIREVLDAWASVKHVAHIETQKRLLAEGLIGGPEGIQGHAGKSLKWDD